MSRAFLAFAFILAGTLLALPARGIGIAGAPQQGWARYEVPMVAGTEGPCCHSLHKGSVTRRGCDLRGGGTVMLRGSEEGSRGRTAQTGSLAVYLHFEAGRIDRVEALAASCPVRTEAAPVELALDQEASLELLAGLVREQAGPADEALLALTHHASGRATSLLEAFAERGSPHELRRNAVFWLGQLRGVPGAAIVERIARTDADADLREHAVFSLSQSDALDTFPIIEDIAATDASHEVRAKALFWMAQSDDARAAAAITAALRRDESHHVRQQAVFALSQLDSGADAALIAIVRGDYPRDAKKTALFWLGQSGSEEAIAFLDSVLAS